MFEATRRARERALAGEGPTLIEAVTMRMHGHAAHDDMKYVPKEQVEEWRQKDPIDRQEARVREARRRHRRRCARRSARRSTRAPRRRWPCRCPTRRPPRDRLFHDGDDEILLGDGNAPWSGFAGGAS